MTEPRAISATCPCGSGISYADCCGRLHNGQPAATAEALMRSRYSAFARLDADDSLSDNSLANNSLANYLIATWHPSHRRDRADELRQHFGNTVWEGLELLACAAGGVDDDSGTVTFCAHFKEGNRRGELHERSRFVKESGRWFYVDGDQLPAIKRGRNDLCWCGSGNKLKRCHG